MFTAATRTFQVPGAGFGIVTSSIGSDVSFPQPLLNKSVSQSVAVEAVAVGLDGQVLDATPRREDDLRRRTPLHVALGGEGYRVLLSDWYDTFAEQAIKLPDFTAINGADPLMSGADVVPTVILHTGTDIWSSTSGSWHVNPDLHSGTVDVELNGGVSGDQIVHMSGNWRCDGA